MIRKVSTRKICLLIFAFCSLMLFSAGRIHAEEKPLLENLWNEVLHSNVDLKAYESEVSSAALKRRFYSSVYAPSLVVKGSNTFAPTTERKKGTMADKSTGALVYAQPFAGGANLTTSLSYSLARPWTKDDTYALQTPDINFSLTQGLLPWWI